MEHLFFHSFGISISIIITGISFFLQQRCCYFLPKDLENDNEKKGNHSVTGNADGKYVQKEKSINFG
ncbi:hypothetical protein [Bacillus anthracis]|uniref:hypothetical protein n=1 Tax=Bacillus anthracis TaxID=1392 RepID=UPI001928F7E2